MAVVVARKKVVTVTVCQQESFDRHVGTKHNLRYIVDEFKRVGVNRWDPEFHQGASNNNHKEVGQGDVERRWEVSEEPSL